MLKMKMEMKMKMKTTMLPLQWSSVVAAVVVRKAVL